MSEQPKESIWQRFRTHLRENPVVLIYGGAGGLVALVSTIIVLVVVLASGGDGSDDVVSGDSAGSATPTATASATSAPTFEPTATPTPTPTSPPLDPSSTVSDISYSTEGGPLGENHLLVIVTVSDDGEQLVDGASVSAQIKLNGDAYATKNGTTGLHGSVELKLTNAPVGCYDTVITGVTVSGLPWEGVFPNNGFAKGGAVC